MVVAGQFLQVALTELVELEAVVTALMLQPELRQVLQTLAAAAAAFVTLAVEQVVLAVPVLLFLKCQHQDILAQQQVLQP